jgi:hypothetical protein
MIKIGLLMLMVVLLPGCTIYHAIGDDVGSYIAPPSGQDFQPVGYRWDYEHTALIYVYRPGTTWSNDELETPSFYMNDDRLFNIKGDGYTWYELKPGNHEIVIRRPLMGLSGIKFSESVGFTLKEVTRMDLTAEAGKVYYMRYSEVDQDAALFKNMTFNKNPLELVTPDVALPEMNETQMIHHGRGLIAALVDPDDVQLVEVGESVNEAEASTESSWNPF